MKKNINFCTKNIQKTYHAFGISAKQVTEQVCVGGVGSHWNIRYARAAVTRRRCRRLGLLRVRLLIRRPRRCWRYADKWGKSRHSNRWGALSASPSSTSSLTTSYGGHQCSPQRVSTSQLTIWVKDFYKGECLTKIYSEISQGCLSYLVHLCWGVSPIIQFHR